MTNRTRTTQRPAAEPTDAAHDETRVVAQYEHAIIALGAIFDAITLVLHEETGLSRSREADIRDGLVAAGGIITAELQRRM